MELTPIKVRGRGRQKKAWRPPEPRRITEKRKRTRDVGSVDGVDGRPPKHSKSRKPPALIEDLPVELLERIILMSRNLNILFSSHRIGKRFSHPHFLTELVEAAFAPTWDELFAHPDTDNMIRRIALNVPGDPQFQSDVLKCRWLTVDLVLNAQEKWARRTDSLQWFSKHPEAREHALSLMERVKARYEKDWTDFRVGCMDRLEAPKLAQVPGTWLEMRLMLDKRFDVHPQTRIPRRLLADPCDSDSIRLLFWLVRGGARLQPEHSGDWELTNKGFNNVLAMGNPELGVLHLQLLYDLDAFSYWPPNHLEDKLQIARDLEENETDEDKKPLWIAAQGVLFAYNDDLNFDALVMAQSDQLTRLASD